MALSHSKKKISAFVKGVNSKNNGEFYYWNCLHSFRTTGKLNLIKKVCENKCFYEIVMPSKDTRISEFNQYLKCDQVPHITYVDLESLIKKSY